ncbi:MAG: (2Fe-2S)-binding protein [Deltaproteobacteria bacterium]|jgi:NADH dehydrogenase/NADH:ubiquinone oxidoreductase subunit G|nr:(2Fe-2S)-binding protein [Deltaproteobacteria bacterium]
MNYNSKKVTGTISVTIDGQKFSVNYGTTLLAAAKDLGIDIPTLCHHPGLPPDGNCRLCLVEFEGRLAASCLFPLRTDGAVFLTDSPLVLEARSFVIKLLLSRVPQDGYLSELAERYGVKPEPRLSDGADGCLRCGRCVRACRAVGTEAISLVGRSRERKVTGPFFEPPIDCLGCLACARSCPTGIISFGEEPRTIWGRDFELISCSQCGRIVGTPQELKRLGLENPICPDCRRREYSSAIKNLPQASFS